MIIAILGLPISLLFLFFFLMRITESMYAIPIMFLSFIVQIVFLHLDYKLIEEARE